MHRTFRAAGPMNSRRRPAILRAAAITLVLAAGLAGCGLLPGDRGERGGPSRAPLDHPAGSTEPGGMTPEAYQEALAAAVEEARPGLDALAAATRYSELLDRAGKAEGAIAGLVERLAAIDPPQSLVSAHGELIGSLDELSMELAGITEAVRGRRLCAAPAAIARLTRSDAADRVRAAEAALGGAGGSPRRARALLPAPVKQANRRLADGTVLIDRRQGGRGELRIDNRGTTQDSVVSLVRGERVLVSVYVARGRRRTLTRIADGSYRVVQTAGVDYDRRLKAFTRDCSFARFDATLRFETTSSTSTIWTVSFRPVEGGNATFSAIPPDEFPTS